MRKLAFIIVVVILSVSTQTIFSQENENKVPWVYETEYQIPWSKVDSLWKLITMVEKDYDWIGKAVELGFILDGRVYIHHTGSIWNVKYQWVYPSWEAINKGFDGKKVWEAVGADEEKVKEINSGFSWVFKDVIHRDQIYRLLVSAD